MTPDVQLCPPERRRRGARLVLGACAALGLVACAAPDDPQPVDDDRPLAPLVADEPPPPPDWNVRAVVVQAADDERASRTRSASSRQVTLARLARAAEHVVVGEVVAIGAPDPAHGVRPVEVVVEQRIAGADPGPRIVALYPDADGTVAIDAPVSPVLGGRYLLMLGARTTAGHPLVRGPSAQAADQSSPDDLRALAEVAR